MAFSLRGRALWTLAACALLAGASGLWLAAPGKAAGRFERPITIVVTFPPGGGTDLLARRLGEQLQQRLGQSVVVENRPGASGNIGAHAVAQATPDGSALLMANSSFAINPGVYERLDFDPRKDFTAVFNAGYIASVLVVPADGPLHSLEEALEQASRERPLAFASCGNGTPQHLAGEMLARQAGRFVQQVPYKGCGPAITAVAAGQVPAGMVTASSASAMIAAGRVRALAVTSAQRLPQLAGVPTVAERGLPGFAVEQWHGLLAPAATPKAVVEALHATLAQALRDPAVEAALHGQGYTLAHQTPGQFQALISSDIERYAAVARELRLRAD